MALAIPVSLVDLRIFQAYSRGSRRVVALRIVYLSRKIALITTVVGSLNLVISNIDYLSILLLNLVSLFSARDISAVYYSKVVSLKLIYRFLRIVSVSFTVARSLARLINRYTLRKYISFPVYSIAGPVFEDFLFYIGLKNPKSPGFYLSYPLPEEVAVPEVTGPGSPCSPVFPWGPYLPRSGGCSYIYRAMALPIIVSRSRFLGNCGF